MHNSLVQPPLSREEIMALIHDKNEGENSEHNPDKEIGPAKTTNEEINKAQIFHL